MKRLWMVILVMWGGVYAQSGAADRGLETASYYLAPVANSGVSGNLQITERLDGGSTFVVTLQGIESGRRYALALFEGDCGPDRPRARNLMPVGNFPDDPYASLTDTEIDFAELSGGDYFLYVYAGATSDTAIAACGEVGTGANATTPSAATPSATTPSATPSSTTSSTSPSTVSPSPTTPETASSPDAPDRSPRAASYALSPVENSGVSGNLQVSENVTGGTRLTVSLTGISAGGNHAIVLYAGDCGPDRPEVARLNSVNGSDGNPNSSVTESELSFEAITTGNHFLYVFSAVPGSQILACGEVGL